jgi:hypothetical protein
MHRTLRETREGVKEKSRMEDGRWRMEDRGWKIEDGRSRMEDVASCAMSEADN